MKKPKKPTRYKMNGMFRYLLICLMLFTGSAHAAAADEFNAVKKAAEQGDADAQHNLGVMYAYGKGVPEDDAEAVRWYLKAAEQGHADAQHNLGVMYAYGKGVALDYAEAAHWRRKGRRTGRCLCASLARSHVRHGPRCTQRLHTSLRLDQSCLCTRRGECQKYKSNAY